MNIYKLIDEFLEGGENFTFGLINEEVLIYNRKEMLERVEFLGVIEIIDTYIEQIVFKSYDNSIYEIGYL